MTVWPRPVPLIGDDTAASERAADPAGWAFEPAERDAFHRIVAARRDVRRYRPDPVPDEVLERVLTAAHAAPSVGHSQPWRFVVVRAPAVRDTAAVLTDRERLRQAAQLEPDAAARLLDLQLAGVREAPLGVVVCCDRRTPAAGVRRSQQTTIPSGASRTPSSCRSSSRRAASGSSWAAWRSRSRSVRTAARSRTTASRTTTKRHGWLCPTEGAACPAASTRRRTSSGTGSGR